MDSTAVVERELEVEVDCREWMVRRMMLSSRTFSLIYTSSPFVTIHPANSLPCWLGTANIQSIWHLYLKVIVDRPPVCLFLQWYFKKWSPSRPHTCYCVFGSRIARLEVTATLGSVFNSWLHLNTGDEPLSLRSLPRCLCDRPPRGSWSKQAPRRSDHLWRLLLCVVMEPSSNTKTVPKCQKAWVVTFVCQWFLDVVHPSGWGRDLWRHGWNSCCLLKEWIRTLSRHAWFVDKQGKSESSWLKFDSDYLKDSLWPSVTICDASNLA